MWIKILVPFVVLGVMALGLFGLESYNQMHQQISYHLGEEMQLMPPEGSVAIDANDYDFLAVEESRMLENPIAATEDSIARGQRAYTKFCIACHGTKLDGEGPVGPSLPNPPKPMNDPSVAALSDGEYFWVINNFRGACPPIGKSMLFEDKWHAVNFIRAFQAGNMTVE